MFFFSGRKKGGNLTLGYGFKCCPFYIRTGPRGLLNAPKPSRSEAQVLPSSAQSGSRWKVAGKNKETAAALVVEASADAELNPSHVIGDASLTSSSSLTNCYTRRPIQILFIIVRQVEYKTIGRPQHFPDIHPLHRNARWPHHSPWNGYQGVTSVHISSGIQDSTGRLS